MEAHKINLLEFIESSKRTFNIPVYQRNYDWKKLIVKDYLKILRRKGKSFFRNYSICRW